MNGDIYLKESNKNAKTVCISKWRCHSTTIKELDFLYLNLSLSTFIVYQNSSKRLSRNLLFLKSAINYFIVRFDSNFKNCISRKYRISEFRIRISRNYQTGYRQWWVTFLSKFDTRITVIELVSYLWARNLWHLCYHSNLYYSIFVKSVLTPEASKDIDNNRLIQMLKEVHKQEGMKNDIKIGWCDDKICYIYYKKYSWSHSEPKQADSYVWAYSMDKKRVTNISLK